MLRKEFVTLALRPDSNMAALCRRFGVSRRVGYKWLARYQSHGLDGLHDRSRRPQHSPGETPDAMVTALLAARDARPAWGARKLRAWLAKGNGPIAVAADELPAVSTIHGILLRNGRIAPDPLCNTPWHRFEADAPNDMWQMDFKGHFALDGRQNGTGTRCHPFVLLDDHSRYCLQLKACDNERFATVQAALIEAFRRYGLPSIILADNGAPWGSGMVKPRHGKKYSCLDVWLIQLGITPKHSTPAHPQTCGKLERLNRSLKLEALQGRWFADFADCQQHLCQWRSLYNLERPHEACDLQPPVSRFQVSTRTYPETLPLPEYPSTDHVRSVGKDGRLRFKGRNWNLSQAFKGHKVGLRQTMQDGVWDVWFYSTNIGQINLSEEQ